MSAEHDSQPADEESTTGLHDFIESYLAGIRQEFESRWAAWPVSIANPGPTEVTVGLLRRQYSLASHLATIPQAWTPEFSPIVLRCMVEVYIWLAWILEDIETRSRLFIDDGLGKEKLIIKHRTDELESAGIPVDEDPILHHSKLWLESQRYSFLVDVNLSGSWSGIDTRKMAEEAQARDFYRFTYPTFSSAVHSTWNHVSRYDLEPCTNPLHAYHSVPKMTLSEPTIEFFRLGAKYLAKTFSLVDLKMGIKSEVPCTYSQTFQIRDNIQSEKPTDGTNSGTA